MNTIVDPVQVPFVDLSAQHTALNEQISQAVSDVIRRGDFILGREVGLFEEEFAAYCGARCGVGVDSGTSALELALRAFDIGPGDEVITAANTFIATTIAISATGAKPVLVDCDPQTYNLDVRKLGNAINWRTKAILPVHLYGQPSDIDPILDLASRYGLIVIEDACQAHGARYKGKRVGSLAHAAAFSFYPAKNLGALGDGGIVLTDDEQAAARLRMLRNYGQREKYHHLVPGYNRRLDTLQAAVLRVKLPFLDASNSARRQHARLYHRLLAGCPLQLPVEPDYAEPVYHLYVIQVEDRDGLQAYLKERGIATGIHYPIPLHLQPACRDYGYKKGDFPVSERYAQNLLSLPMYPELTPELITYVIENIKAAVLKNEA